MDRKRDDLRSPRLARLLGEQHQMIARRQLAGLGIDWDAVEANVAARRWVVRTPRVISTITGALTVEQRRWLGVLHAGPRSMLGGLTAGDRHGLIGWGRPDVTVLIDDELSFDAVPGVHFFRSRRPFPLMVSPKPGIASCQIEPALLLWAGYDATARAAAGVLAAAVQQRLTTADRLIDWVDVLRPLRRAKLFKRVLSDIAGGAHSGAELDVARMCRLYRMPLPGRQRSRTDRAGRRRWTDCEWDLPNGAVLVLEVDGAHHMEAAEWEAGMRRNRRLVNRDRMVVSCSAYEVRHESLELAADLIALGLPGQLPDNAA